MWNPLLLAASALLIAGCNCCPQPPSPPPSATHSNVAGLVVSGNLYLDDLLDLDDLSWEMARDAQGTMVAEWVNVVGCSNVLKVARIPFRLDFEISGDANFCVFVPEENAELARSVLARWADCPGYRCRIVRPIPTVEPAVEK